MTIEKEELPAKDASPDLTMDVYRPLRDPEHETEGGNASRIKSFAVDLRSTVTSPPKFLLLRNNTNLNTTPTNWLSVLPKKILGPALFTQSQHLRSPSFTSFQMASSLMDSGLIGDVDVVSDAENIKKLLKIPYSKSAVSMMVHRVGNTILLDEFDIHTHLLRAAENEWGWLKKFYMEHVFASLRPKEDVKTTSSEDARFGGKNSGTRKPITRHSREFLQQQNLISKFLYHSLGLADSPSASQQPAQDVSATPDPDQRVQPMHNNGPAVPADPNVADNGLQDPSLPQPFSKNIMWTFEDLRMFIGTDLPIFGGGTHPCLSLRLRDMSKPINVLTGLDYWLDNLMCNVPEVVMCYHLDGLVQKYELIKTDDLPRLPNCQFKPAIIKDVAQNILSFLKSKATKAGHTYWLFKGKGEDIVKLYDLTSLCSELNEDNNQNPFTTPVAMLLFKVARNLKNSSDWKRYQGTVLALLKNCLAILDAAKYPQVATAALYYLSDVYLPASFKLGEEDGSSEKSAEEEENWDYAWEDDDEAVVDNQFSASVDVKALSTPQQVLREEDDEIGMNNNNKTSRPTGVVESLEQRCSLAIQHAVQALECIMNERKIGEESSKDGPPLASPLKPIPMPYEKLLGGNRQTESTGTSLIAKEPVPDDWRQHYWKLLMEKCCLALVTLASQEGKNGVGSLSSALGHLNRAARLWDLLDIPPGPLRNGTFSLAGDLYFSAVQQWNDDLATANPPEHSDPALQQLDRLLECLESKKKSNKTAEAGKETFSFPVPNNLQEALQFSLDNYRSAVISFSSNPESGSLAEGASLAKRLGNVCNEMGVFFMSKAAKMVEEPGYEWGGPTLQLFQLSRQHLEDGASIFRKISDWPNVALLSCNLAKLYRVQARALAPAEKKEASLAEWKSYSKSLQYYKEALDVLKVRTSTNSGIWDAVVWDYTTVLFTLASLLQDFAPLSIKSREYIEGEIVRLLETCIEYSLAETSNARGPLLQYRAATCHYRLASLYHDTYRNGDGEAIINGRNVRTESESHYTNACELFSQLENWDEVIRLQLEKAGLYEFQLKRLTGTGSKIRVLQSVLNCFLSTAPALSALIIDQPVDTVETKTADCLTLMGPRIQSTLLQLAKLTKGAKNSPTAEQAESYRKMYATALTYNGKESDWPIKLARIITELAEMKCEQNY